MEDLKAALQRIRDAQGLLAAFLKQRYPVGAPIYWKWNGVDQAGTVADHASGDRIKVRNSLSGRTYWIYAFRICGSGRC